MTRSDAALATALRYAQWELDEAAFEIGGGRYSDAQCHELATALEQLASALRCHYVAPKVIEVEA